MVTVLGVTMSRKKKEDLTRKLRGTLLSFVLFYYMSPFKKNSILKSSKNGFSHLWDVSYTLFSLSPSHGWFMILLLNSVSKTKTYGHLCTKTYEQHNLHPLLRINRGTQRQVSVDIRSVEWSSPLVFGVDQRVHSDFWLTSTMDKSSG